MWASTIINIQRQISSGVSFKPYTDTRVEQRICCRSTRVWLLLGYAGTASVMLPHPVA